MRFIRLLKTLHLKRGLNNRLLLQVIASFTLEIAPTELQNGEKTKKIKIPRGE